MFILTSYYYYILKYLSERTLKTFGLVTNFYSSFHIVSNRKKVAKIREITLCYEMQLFLFTYSKASVD